MDITKTKEVLETARVKMQKAVQHFSEELASFRAGKANPAVFQGLVVDYYGTPTPIDQMSSISTPDARTMLIQPWDKKMIPLIEKAIMAANLGFTPQNNGETIRINVPPLTEERRKELVKKARSEGEAARVSVRNIRRDQIEVVKKMQKEGLPEDMAKDTEGLIQKETEHFYKKIDELLTAKEKEIMTV
ncbi:MAG: ribosome recycling factor [Bacteroidales bacterium]|nr:ribosome recycling factor [Bacteroidales bacterium]MCL2738549.1 ribosome recycling factor [Bacteroidales bacterium]